MRKPILAILALILASLACTQVVVTPTPASMIPASIETVAASPAPLPSASPQPAATDEQTARVVAASVNVRQLPGGDPTGEYIYAGQPVIILEYSGDWVRIAEPEGWVFRGCVSDNPDGLLCQAKESE